MKYSIEIKNVSKSYGNQMVLKNVSLQVTEGSMVALLGPNGAGKSTLIDIIATLKKTDQGMLFINGYCIDTEIEQIRKSIGIVFQNSMLDDLLTVEENLYLRCGFYGLYRKDAKQRIQELCEITDIQDFLKQKVQTLSGGQHRRVDIARALIMKPRLLLLDEPTTGLDPSSRSQIWTTIQALQQDQKMTVFLTTHYLEEAKYADVLYMLKQGRIVAQGTPQSIRETYANNWLYLYSDRMPTLQRQLDIQKIAYQPSLHKVRIHIKHSMHALSILKRMELYISHFEIITSTLDDAFLNLMKGDGTTDDTIDQT